MIREKLIVDNKNSDKNLKSFLNLICTSILVFLLSAFSLQAQSEVSSISSKPGAFSRMGFGARGMGMGNAMTAVLRGNLVSYYNPAATPFQEGNMFQTSYSFLSLDRSLNFLNFTRKFEFGKSNDPAKEGKPRSVAGLSIGFINSGVGDIEERDNQGIKTGDLSTSENQGFLGLSNRFSEKFSIGIGLKFYYYKLYEDFTSTGFGIDLGVVYLPNENLSIAFMISDINSKYEWNSNALYGVEGTNTREEFPILKKLGAAYYLPEYNLLVSAEFEASNAQTNIVRLGAEYGIYEGLFIRAGLDRWNLKNSDAPAKPSAGFSYFYKVNSMTIGIDYAFVVDPLSSSDQHIAGVSFKF